MSLISKFRSAESGHGRSACNYIFIPHCAALAKATVIARDVRDYLPCVFVFLRTRRLRPYEQMFGACILVMQVPGPGESECIPERKTENKTKTKTRERERGRKRVLQSLFWFEY